jgi:nucleotide-binding universal stress UspA family protein
MFQRILIPLDGSPRAELILPQVAHLLKRKASVLFFVRSVATSSPAKGGDDTTPPLVHLREEAESYLQGVARRYTDAGANVHTRVLEGAPAEAILDAARREGATMIAMTTHGRTGLLKWLIGSVADKVIRASDVPVLLIRPSHLADPPAREPATPGESPFRRILIATDGSPTSMAIVDPARQFAALFGSEIVALHVWDSYVPDGAPLLGMEAGMAALPEAPSSSEDEVTARVARQLGPSGLKVTRVTRYGEPASAILDQSEEHEVDLIALATHDRSELSRWMTGSVAERVLKSAGVPLLIVRAMPDPTHRPAQPEFVLHPGEASRTSSQEQTP